MKVAHQLHVSFARITMKKNSKQKTSRTVNAIELLTAEHREVESLFEDFHVAMDDEEHETARAIALQVCEKLTLHANAEEELFYPAVQDDETKEILAESAVEHLSVKRLIQDIRKATGDGEKLKALMSVLQDQVEHHVEEEEATLFPLGIVLLAEEELLSLAEQMQHQLKKATAITLSGDALGDGDEEAENEENHTAKQPKVVRFPRGSGALRASKAD